MNVLMYYKSLDATATNTISVDLGELVNLHLEGNNLYSGDQ